MKRPSEQRCFDECTLPAMSVDVPRQLNGYDCGLFALTYIDYWVDFPPASITISKKGR